MGHLDDSSVDRSAPKGHRSSLSVALSRRTSLLQDVCGGELLEGGSVLAVGSVAFISLGCFDLHAFCCVCALREGRE